MPVSYLRRAKSSDLEQLVRFLEANGLTTAGVESCYANFVIATDEKGTLLGVAGLEIYGQSAFNYFKNLGFDLVDRKDIDEAVMASLEFTECRSTALAMRKTI
jgi:N-acetylglutamate synthase-like GNAT family acetyltransferase